MVQVPSGAAGAAVGVLVWSITCWLCNSLMIWLLWTGNERRSFISLICWCALCTTTASIIQQAHDITYYDDVMTERLERIKTYADSPLVAASNGSVGLDTILWTIRYACYIAEAGLGFFWSFSLAQAVYGWREHPRWHRTLAIINRAGKPASILIAVTIMCLVHIPALQRSYFWWFFVLHFFYATFCLGGIAFLLSILFEYIQTKRLFRRMNSQQRKEFETVPTARDRAQSASTTATSVLGAPSSANTASFGALQQQQGGIYDKWLIARFSLPFLALCLFEVDNILVGKVAHLSLKALADSSAPDLTAESAIKYFVTFMPGCLASIVTLVTFGTTNQFRDKLYRTFVPFRWQKQQRRRKWPESGEVSYMAMDNDPGMLSRYKRLDMERKMQIEVTIELDIKTEKVDAPVVERYHVDSHHWDDTEMILPPRTPSAAAWSN